MENYKGTILVGVELYAFDVFRDFRGHFSTTYNQNEFSSLLGYNVEFIQDNESFSKKM
jgi:dTDP-4-dehydrorhamnose 3,5-epimerase-like enzyme